MASRHRPGARAGPVIAVEPTLLVPNAEVRAMNILFKLMLAIVVGAVCGTAARTSALQPARTTWSGIYTDGQSKRGQAVYEEQCLSCHSPDLKGADQAPPLTGDDFNMDWNDLSVSDLFERIRI